MDQATKNHLSSYPFGKETKYKTSALLFRQAAKLFRACGQEKKFLESTCFYYDCLADHNYYICGDWRMASRYYERAEMFGEKLFLRALSTDEKSFWESEIFYFRALKHESLAFAFEKEKNYVRAKKDYSKAINWYKECLKRETDRENQKLLRHSIIGLLGGLFFVEGLIIEKSDKDRAKQFFSRAISLYRKALKYHPSWKNTGHRDDYVIWVEQVIRHLR